jgi:hypothetical protein
MSLRTTSKGRRQVVPNAVTLGKIAPQAKLTNW